VSESCLILWVVSLQLIEELNYEGSISDIDGGKLILYSNNQNFLFVKSSHCHHHVSWTLRVQVMYIYMFPPSNANCNLESSTSESGLIPCLIAELNRTSIGNAITLFRSSFLQPLLKACKVYFYYCTELHSVNLRNVTHFLFFIYTHFLWHCNSNSSEHWCWCC